MNEAEFIEISDFMNLLADRSKVITLEGFNSNLTLQVKDDGSPVTDYDINSEKILREIISAKFPIITYLLKRWDLHQITLIIPGL